MQGRSNENCETRLWIFNSAGGNPASLSSLTALPPLPTQSAGLFQLDFSLGSREANRVSYGNSLSSVCKRTPAIVLTFHLYDRRYLHHASITHPFPFILLFFLFFSPAVKCTRLFVFFFFFFFYLTYLLPFLFFLFSLFCIHFDFNDDVVLFRSTRFFFIYPPYFFPLLVIV